MTIKEQAVSDAMIEKVWADFVNCQDDRYFGNKTKRGHQLAVLRRFADSILASHPLEQQQAVSGDDFEFEVYCDHEWVAGCSGPKSHALAEAMHYAAVCQADGQVQIKQVIRRDVSPEEARTALQEDGRDG